MTLLEIITKASTNPHSTPSASQRPIPLNSDSILLSLEPDSVGTNPNPISLVQPLTGFKISDSEFDLVALNCNFSNKLGQMLKTPPDSPSTWFRDSIIAFLKEISGKVGIPIVIEGDDMILSVGKLIEKLSGFIGKEVMGLIIEGCIDFRHWRLLETLIVNMLVDHSYRSNLVYNLTVKRRSDLLCLCVKHFSDLKSGDLCWLLKYFLSPSKEAYATMKSVSKEWNGQAWLAIEKVRKKLGQQKDSVAANEAAILLMMANDEFTRNELCLHYLLSSSSIDDVVFSNAIGKLNMEEMLGLIRYLRKWLRKYERFPQAVPCRKGVKGCAWVPKLEQVVVALGVVFDEHFTSLVLQSQFHEELKAIEGIVGCLVSEGRLCCSMANLIDILNPQVRDE